MNSNILPDSKNVLVLQGGGALGAYQAGVYEALCQENIELNWVAGISIGAINAAIIAGNAASERLDKLREFWNTVSSGLMGEPTLPGDHARTIFNDSAAAMGAMFGLPGFFQPRLPPAVFFPPGSTQALSLYDTGPLRETLERLIDFDRINNDGMRFSVGAVNIRTGNFIYFDNTDSPRQRAAKLKVAAGNGRASQSDSPPAGDMIGPEHIMASAALPPGFPPVEVDGDFYWDGGIVSNTPLQYVLDQHPRPHMSIFQIDLFSARGNVPDNLLEVTEREKDIRFSSRTRLNTDDFKNMQELRRAAKRLVDKLPRDLKQDADAKRLEELSCGAEITILQLIHRAKAYHSQSKDYEFSRHSITEHWRSGYKDLMTSVEHHDWKFRDPHPLDVQVFDLTEKLDPGAPLKGAIGKKGRLPHGKSRQDD